MFAELADQQPIAGRLQRSLERGRLAHGYLFVGDALEPMARMAKALAQALNCESPSQKGETGLGVEGCGKCRVCRLIRDEIYPDMLWVRPESKMRIIKIEQIRDLIGAVNLKPSEGQYKIGVLVDADRLNSQSANAFLKTLEEPPPRSILILMTTAPDRLLDTILSRCLRMQFATIGGLRLSEQEEVWLADFAQMAGQGSKSLLSRYRLLGLLMERLASIKEEVEEILTERSPLTKYKDAEKDQREKWETELDAAIDGEYKRRRGELLQIVQWWLRDVWLATSRFDSEMAVFPGISASTESVASRIKPEEAVKNLEVMEGLLRLLHTNTQETLALEVNLLRLKL
jgi:DNA polymerase-3 subunit delta'